MNHHQKLLKLVNESLNRSTPLTFEDFNTSFSDLGVDSLDRMLIFVAAQEAFGVHIPDDKTLELNSMLKLKEWIAKECC